MSERISPRIEQAIAALPLRPDMRVLEIGCGPGVAARAVSRLLTIGRIVAIDRSTKAIAQAKAGSKDEMAAGRLEFRQVAIEDFDLAAGEERFDLAFAMRVGALDGRHPELEQEAMARLKAALKPEGLLVIDDRAPVRARDIPGFP
ncbi:class I SAM-dependent methyltransferase [Devosia sediminis]|uniref:Class I SAM-dependent methyltransferase n=1 Tax=Devosia sediminis TaxID=2798801 RepID=A0A934IY20_9HYPH|nr:class I SAM-dependent methyltransferase [Devosia sediminis]MBJ3786502.1 class I SAM-dependent methyltransferase [Devosia sediminis]